MKTHSGRRQGSRASLRGFAAALVASLFGLVAFAGGAGATAGVPITLSTNSSSPQVAVDSNGTAHIVWNGVGPDAGNMEYCQIPAGGSACIDPQRFYTPNYEGTARVLLGPAPGEVVALDTMFGPDNSTFVNAYVSMDGGHTFSSGVIGGGYSAQGGTDQTNLAAGEPAFGPGGLGASWMDQKGWFESFPVNSGPSPTALCNPMDPTAGVGCGPPAVFTDTRLLTTCTGQNSIALLNNTAPVVACVDYGTGTVYYRVATGQGNLNDVSTGSWGPVEQYAASADGIGAWLAGGPRGVYLLFTASNDSAEVSKLTNGTFGPPTAVARNTFPEALSEDATGDLFALTSDTPHGGGGAQQRVFTSPDGVHWTEVPLNLGGVIAGNANAQAQIAGCAAAGGGSTGSGFIVFNSTTNTAPFTIYAESFGSAPCGGRQGAPTRISTGALVVSPNGVTAVPLRCGSGPVGCDGVLKLIAPVRGRNGHRRTITIASAAYSIASRQTAKVRLHLNARGLQLLTHARHHELKVTAVAATAHTNVILVLRPARR